MAICFEKARKLMKEQGINSYTIKKTNAISQGVLTKLRKDQGLTTQTIDNLCKLLNCQPGDLMEYIPDEEAHQKPSP